MSEQVILVNQNDQALNYMDKAEAHQKGALHGPFLFLFSMKRKKCSFKRALTKYHTPGIWSNTTCSHQEKRDYKRSC